MSKTTEECGHIADHIIVDLIKRGLSSIDICCVGQTLIYLGYSRALMGSIGDGLGKKFITIQDIIARMKKEDKDE